MRGEEKEGCGKIHIICGHLQTQDLWYKRFSSFTYRPPGLSSSAGKY